MILPLKNIFYSAIAHNSNADHLQILAFSAKAKIAKDANR